MPKERQYDIQDVSAIQWQSNIQSGAARSQQFDVRGGAIIDDHEGR